MRTVREPAVAGTFYPRDPAQLAREVDALLEAACANAEAASRTPVKAVLVPHAGYVYSGPIAASAYRSLRPGAARVRRVVLLGPAHRVALRGLALPGVDAFATPLGEVAVDAALVARLRALPQVHEHPGSHALEHSLEVQLPFLQRLLGEFTLLPLVVGDASPAEVAEVLRTVWGGDETLIVISSDLSHYLPHALAARVDRATVGQVLDRDATLSHEQACGAMPLNGLLAAAADLGLEPVLADLRNSGDTAGDRARVVGYAAVLFHESDTHRRQERPSASVADSHVAHARAAIAEALGLASIPPAASPAFEAPGAVFVTLLLDGRLRGCIGSLEPHRPLREDLRANAVAAAFRDPRFPPLSAAEFARVRVEVSELEPAEPLVAGSETEAWAAVEPGIHGVILEWGRHRSTFLPQVWAQLPTPREFFAALKCKAGLPADFWAPDVRLARYTVRKWAEA
jgi:AmmeMemoRadiSam system protein B/AmmeMemoRadiSam system protein A